MDGPIRLLVVDDDTELCELLEEYLEPHGFSVMSIHDGESGLRTLAGQPFDAVILDVMLPGRDGLEVLRGLRAQSDLPVLMLTARGDDVDRIVGLELGADDYLPKPFNPRELLARLRAILRRSRRDAGETAGTSAGDGTSLPRPPGAIQVGDIALNPGTRSATRAGKPLALTTVEFNLLETMLRAAGEVLSREELSLQVLGRKLQAYDRSLDVHVSNLRKKLGELPDGSERIKTVRGVGYLYSLVEIEEASEQGRRGEMRK
ncbi:MAG: response regulator transcription factor [Thermodesulfobacteriota bacterium]|nr:response regulator transcription factor [Thermodesulfobacteriota bacterium]